MRIKKKCRNKKCRQDFGVVRLLDNNKAQCPFCKFPNKLGKKQIRKFVINSPFFED